MAASTHYARLARRIYGRTPEKRCRFWFHPSAEPGLIVETNTAKGMAAFDQLTSRIEIDPAGPQPHVGLLVTEPGGHYVFCGPTCDEAFLASLAGWARDRAVRWPFLVSLEHATAAQTDVPASVEAAEALALSDLEIHRARDLWDGLATPTPQGIAHVLATALPGEAFWIWCAEQEPGAGIPFLAEQVRTDPGMGRLSQRAAHIPLRRGAFTATGVGRFVEDGTLQVVGRGFTRTMLSSVAEWVVKHGPAHPELYRLRNLELLEEQDGTIAQVLTAPEHWSGLPSGPCPGTLQESVQVLDALQPGEMAYFWLTPDDGDGAPFLSAFFATPGSPLVQDRLQNLIDRYGRHDIPSVAGHVGRLGSGALVFSTEGELAHWGPATQVLSEAHPELAMLNTAKLVKRAGPSILAIA